MRNILIIGLLLLLAVWLLVMPAVVGVYLRDAVPEWLAEWSSPEEASFQPGWFGSELTWQPETEIRLRLNARHFPPLRIGWMHLDGELDVPLTTEPARVAGHLGLTGSWHLHAAAADFRPVASSPVAARDLRINLSQAGGQPLSLLLSAATLRLNENTPGFSNLRVRALRRPADNDMMRVGLDLELDADELGTGRVTLQAGPVHPDQLGILVQGLGQLAESTPGSMSEGMALVTLVGAWQEMAAAGLVIELERLEFGPSTAFEGRWIAARPAPRITGSGQLSELSAWLQRLLPDAFPADPDGPEPARALLADLGQLHTDRDQFRFSDPESPLPDRLNPAATR